MDLLLGRKKYRSFLFHEFINFIVGRCMIKKSDDLYEDERFENIIYNAKHGEESFDKDLGDDINKKSQDEEINIVETKKETDKKCPQCDGILDFDPESGGLICPYCGYKEEIEQDEKRAEELDFNKAECIENCNWGVEIKTVICKSCGAETVYDNLEISGVCPYCGSNQVMEAKDVNTIAPGGVCIFKVTEKEALSN